MCAANYLQWSQDHAVLHFYITKLDGRPHFLASHLECLYVLGGTESGYNNL